MINHSCRRCMMQLGATGRLTAAFPGILRAMSNASDDRSSQKNGPLDKPETPVKIVPETRKKVQATVSKEAVDKSLQPKNIRSNFIFLQNLLSAIR